jgi:nucleotide-binding universal stress UspA family protein
MLDIRKVLCPVDFSECSRHALDHAAAIARWYGAELTVLHVVSTTPVAAYVPGIGSSNVAIAAADHRQTLSDLSPIVAAVGALGVPAVPLMREGDTVREILETASDLPADLVVIGTHGRSGFERLALGSVTEKVLRRARCPVLSVPPRALEVDPSQPVRYRRILCPVDFSDSSMNALRYATSLAQESDARLTVLHVLEYGPYDWPELYETFLSNDRLSVADFRTRYREASRERLELAVSEKARQYCTVETLLADGTAYKEILRVAREQRSDLAVIGVYGRSAVDLAFFGSTTQHVVRQAACPVLTLRAA